MFTEYSLLKESVGLFSRFFVGCIQSYIHQNSIRPWLNIHLDAILYGPRHAKSDGRHILSIFSFKLFCPLHSPNNMMEVIKVRK